MLWIAAVSVAIYWLARKDAAKEAEAQAATSGSAPIPYVMKGAAPNVTIYHWEPGSGYAVDSQRTEICRKYLNAGGDPSLNQYPCAPYLVS